jgi:hypothetical protein
MEPLCSYPALTVTLRSVHSATKQKTEPLRSRLPNTEQSGPVPRTRNETAPFYLAPQPNTTLHTPIVLTGERRATLLTVAVVCRMLPAASTAVDFSTSSSSGGWGS